MRRTRPTAEMWLSRRWRPLADCSLDRNAIKFTLDFVDAQLLLKDGSCLRSAAVFGQRQPSGLGEPTRRIAARSVSEDHLPARTPPGGPNWFFCMV